MDLNYAFVLLWLSVATSGTFSLLSDLSLGGGISDLSRPFFHSIAAD